MEQNSSNALVMAGGMLLAIMIISLAVFTFQSSAEFARTYEDTIEQTNLKGFNTQFEIYERDNLSIYDIITVGNLAKDINEKNGFQSSDSYYIHIKLSGESKEIQQMNDKEIYSLISKYTVNGKIQQFRCKNGGLDKNATTGRVVYMEFELMNK